MDNKFVVFSYIVLGLISGYCLYIYIPTVQTFAIDELYKNFALVTYTIFLLSSLTGSIVYVMEYMEQRKQRLHREAAHSDDNHDVHEAEDALSIRTRTATNIQISSRCNLEAAYKVHSFLMYCHLSLAIPCYITHIWIKYKFVGLFLAFIHSFIGIIFAVVFLLFSETNNEYLDSLTSCCTYALFLIGYDKNDRYLLVATAFLASAYWILREYRFILRLTPDESYLYLISGFALAGGLAAVKSIK